MNRWNIPAALEKEVVARDTSCVYCGVAFGQQEASFRNRPSWEHIVNDAKIVTKENISLCCRGCNSSKGAKALSAWLQSKYCFTRGIRFETVAPVVRESILRASAGA